MRLKILDEAQKHSRRDFRITGCDRLRGIVTDPSLAANKEHADIGNRLHRHPVVACPARQPAHRHWFRARFGANRFRLFFRADSASRIVVYAWVNDRDTLRKTGAVSDPYAVFARMLAHGNPPDDWPRLLAAAQDPAAMQRFAAVAPRP